jgi:glycosyltransferase involved in cell wall biosynthesis
LKIWIINAYGNLPSEGWSEYRTTLMANALSEAGHEVVWWVSNFEHRSKKFRSIGSDKVIINKNFTINIVPSTAYYKHISFARIIYERNFCNNLYDEALQLKDYPDVIIVGEPALFASDIIIKLVKKVKSKLVIDIIDIWPELFSIFLPKYLVRFERILFFPFYIRRSWFIKKADALVAVSNDYLDLGRRYFKSNLYDTIYWGLSLNRVNSVFSPEMVNLELTKYQIPLKHCGDFYVIYAGTLGDNYDLKTILNVALRFNKIHNHIKFIIAGDGPLFLYISNFIFKNKLSNVFFIGRIDNESLHCLFSVCDIGLCSYVKNSTVSMPIKFYDYVSAGLPILSSLDREISKVLYTENIGLTYLSENENDLADKILLLFNNPEFISVMKKNALVARDKFSYGKQYDKIVKLLAKIK